MILLLFSAAFSRRIGQGGLLSLLCSVVQSLDGNSIYRPSLCAGRYYVETLAVRRATAMANPSVCAGRSYVEILTARMARLHGDLQYMQSGTAPLCGDPLHVHGSAMRRSSLCAWLRNAAILSVCMAPLLLPDRIGFVSTPSLLRLTLFLRPLSKADSGTPAVFLDELDSRCF